MDGKSINGFNYIASFRRYLAADGSHVHHIVPLSTIGAEYKLDPIKDLIPLCPNCHAVVRRGSEVMSIETLKEHLAEAKRRSALATRPHSL
ncbi:HNH endonuclease [Pseudomonas sp. UFMG81]|uniref:HNH endonuclease n=1 Tax=Pseudomonas sp. UFMG81 TaxID=2745936 RepID=UPI003A5C191E